jgi:hypothetical protein
MKFSRHFAAVQETGFSCNFKASMIGKERWRTVEATAFQADDEGSIPFTRSTAAILVHACISGWCPDRESA